MPKYPVDSKWLIFVYSTINSKSDTADKLKFSDKDFFSN